MAAEAKLKGETAENDLPWPDLLSRPPPAMSSVSLLITPTPWELQQGQAWRTLPASENERDELSFFQGLVNGK